MVRKFLALSIIILAFVFSVVTTITPGIILAAHPPILDSITLQTPAIVDGGVITLTVETTTDAPFKFLIVQVLGPNLNNPVTYNQNMTEVSPNHWKIDFLYDISPWMPSGVYTLTNIYVINESFLQSDPWPEVITFTVQNGASGIITPETGGILTYTNKLGQQSIVEVPPGAVTQMIELEYIPVEGVIPPAGLFLVGDHKFELRAYVDGIIQYHYAFSLPITTTFFYSDSDVAGNEKDIRLFIYNHDNEIWIDSATTCDPIPDYERDIFENWITIQICHLTQFSLLNNGQMIYLPIIFR